MNIKALGRLFRRHPSKKQDLVDFLNTCKRLQIVDAESIEMMEGVIQVSEVQARDIMIPKAQMSTVNITMNFDDILSIVVESHHARFPVLSKNSDEVLGILLAKELLPFILNQDDQRSYDIQDHLHPAMIVPESIRLDKLLKDFRSKRSHMAIVIDEYGAHAGLITIEDVIEQIVGEIEDESHTDELDSDDIRPGPTPNSHIIKGHTTIEALNKALDTSFDASNFDTIAGLLAQHAGKIPRRSDTIDLDGIFFRILNADARQIKLVELVFPHDQR